MYTAGSRNDGGAGHIGSPTLPVSRPLCIPVRFQPLGGTTPGPRWVGGTGALAAAASALPSPLDDDDDGRDDGRGMAVAARYGMTEACAPDAGNANVPPPTPAPVDGALTTPSAQTQRPWLWPIIGALVLVLVLCGGGAAWIVWQKRQRAQASAVALAPADARASDAVPNGGVTSNGIATSSLLSSSSLTTMPASPLLQSPVYTDRNEAFVAQPLSLPFGPVSQAGLASSASWASTNTAGATTQWPQPSGQPAMSVLVGSPRQQQHQQQQSHHGSHTMVKANGQGQARGTYVMVERPPLRMRNVTAATRRANAYSDDEEDEDDNRRDGGNKNGHKNDRQSTRTQSRSASRGDLWTRRAPPQFRQMPMSPQESHYGENPAALPRRDADGYGNGRVQPQRHSHPAELIDKSDHVGGGDGDDEDSLIGGVADYWADAERARQTYFASPQERAAHAMNLGPHAYSPDGTPMPLRS
ncbi:Flil-like domain-containing protein [Pandoravirus kuranda]|uniref:Flil-like domain-containing protein n=1 Tax=Pandoravirus kuranda TaxID=3019033 RepID=A0AA95EGF4_9VIRU|nr:Flil-like domain-containing protein [Pandoravirus kuranda]